MATGSDEKIDSFSFGVYSPPALDDISEKLDKIIEFQERLAPFFPLLERVAAMVDNPAVRFRDVARFRKAAKEDK